MTASLSGVFSLQEFTDAGLSGVGFRLYTYIAGTTTFKTAYTDAAQTVPQTYTSDGVGGQYIALNARGELPAPLYLATGSYDLSLKRADGTTVWTRQADPVSDSSAGAYAAITALGNSTGSGSVGFLQNGASATARTLQSKGRDTVNLNDFLTDAQRIDVAAGTLSIGCSSALLAARAALPAAGGVIYLPRGKILLDTAITLSGPGRVRLVGDGFAEAANNTGATELVKATALTSAVLNITAPGTCLEHLVVRGAVGNTGDNIQISANSVSLDNVSVFSAGQDNVRVGLDAGTNANSWKFMNCRFFNAGRDNLSISDNVSPTLPNASAGSWFNCVAQAAGRDNVRIGNATLNNFSGGVIENASSVGVRLNGTGCAYNTFIGVDFDSGNAAGKMRIEAGAVFNRVDSATLLDTEIVDNGTLSQLNLPSSSNAGWYSKGVFRMQMGNPGGPSDIISGGGGGYTRFVYGGDAPQDSNAQVVIASNGLHLGKSTSGLIGFFDATPIAKPTTAAASSNFVAGGGTAINTASTFDGYTIPQIVRALRLYGLLQ